MTDDRLALETWAAIRELAQAVERQADSVEALRGLIATGIQISGLPEIPVPVVQAPQPLVIPPPTVEVAPVDLSPLYDLLDRPATDEQSLAVLRAMLAQLEQLPKHSTSTWSPGGGSGGATAGGLTDTQLRASPVSVSGPLTDAQLRAAAVAVAGTITANQGASAWVVKDDYQTGEILADQTGAGAVLTFTFSAAVQMVVVFANGTTTDIARVDPFGGTPSATLGIPAGDEAALYLPVQTSTVKVFAPASMVVSVAGLRRS